MIQPETLLHLKLLYEAPGLPLGAATDRIHEIQRVAAARPVPGRVEGRLRDGRFTVRVAGHLLSIDLPEGVRPGDTLHFRFLAGGPRPAFALLASPAGAVFTTANVSEAGRLIAALAPEHAVLQNSPAVSAGEPVLAAMPAEAGIIGERLRQAISTSGVFYESHQAQWVEGKRTTAELLQEPQGQLSPSVRRRDSEPDARGPGADIQMRDDPASREISAPLAAEQAETAAPELDTKLLDPETLPLVQQQLATLETGRLAWHGQIWPGQWMEWDVTHSGADEEQAGMEQPAWQTRLRLVLPHLGEVEFGLRLTAAGLHLSYRAGTAAALAMQAESAALRQSLEAAGVNVLSLAGGSDAGA